MTLRLGLSGCEVPGVAALVAAQRQPFADVIALHDDHAERAAAVAATHGVGFATASFDALLGQGVDGVVLCGPLAARLAQVQAAAEQSVPVLVHAPLAIDLAAAEAMVAACTAHEVRLAVAFAGASAPEVEDLRRIVHDGWLGGAVAVQSLVGRPATAAAAGPPLGGALWQLATDHLHLAHHLLGRPALHVTAQAAHGTLPIGEDGAVATALLRGGLLATFTATRLGDADELLVVGTQGAFGLSRAGLWLQGERPVRSRLLAYERGGVRQVWTRDELATLAAPFAARSELHGRFARWLDDEDDVPCTGEQALEQLRVFAAAARAAHSGRTESV